MFSKNLSKAKLNFNTFHRNKIVSYSNKKKEEKIEKITTNLRPKKTIVIEEKYADEEFKKLHDGKILKIVEINEQIIAKLVKFRKFSFFLGMPFSILIPLINEHFFSDLSEASWKYSIIYHFLFLFDSILLGSSCLGVFGLRNIVVLVNYLTKEKKLEMTKISLFGKKYKCQLQEPDNLLRWKRNFFNPFLSIKNKKTQECFSFNMLGEIKDKKLYYTVLPTKKHNQKHGSLDETML